MRKFWGFLLVLAVAVAAEKARFDNYRVHLVLPTTESQIQALRGLQSSNDYNFWTEIRPPNNPVYIMVPPHKRADFESFVEENKLQEDIFIENVQSLIDEEESAIRTRDTSMEWTNYHTLEEIYSWLDELEQKYPKIVKTIVGGKTYEGRKIKGIEITFGNNFTGVFIESGIHAREWIAPASTTWMINEILKAPSDSVFKKFNYMYFPVFNPDGYEYTWKTNRMWRKTRTPYMGSFYQCYGADPNRNWNFHWNEIGSSSDPCSETYSGPYAFSEVETLSMAEFLNKTSKSRRQDIFLCYHSYSQLILYPWGYTSQPAPNDAVFNKIGLAAAKALEAVNGEKFTVGSIYKTIYPVSGSSVEWYYYHFNGTIDLVYELRDKGRYGFILPAKYIIPSGQEQLASLEAILVEYLKL